MGVFAAGQVVIVHFPFSDLTASKLRPAIVLAEAGGGDSILCQITSKTYGDVNGVQLDTADFAKGSLRLTSYSASGKTIYRPYAACFRSGWQFEKPKSSW